jgi:chitinase
MTSKRARAAIAAAAAGVVAAAGAVFVTANANAASPNILSNPGFESGSLSGWTCDAGTASVVTSPVHSGTYALGATPTSSDDAQCTQTVSVQPNTSYTLSGYVQGSYVYLGITGGTDNWTPSATSWQQLSTTFTTSASQTSVQVYVHGWYAQPEYFADDLALTGPAGSSPPPSSSSPTPTPSKSASPSSSPSSSPSKSPTPSASPSTSPTGTNGGGGGTSGLPAHVLAGYWQDFTNTAEPLSLASVPSGYNLVDVAFANADSANDGGVTFSIDPTLASDLGGYTAAQFTADVKTLQSRGQKVVLSVGGQNGDVTVADASEAANFANSVYSLMKTYGFNGVDIDMENGINPTYMAQALESLRTMAGSSLIITLAPQTLDMYQTTSDYFALALDIKSILTISYTQYYNSGSMNSCNGSVVSEGTEDFVTGQACFQLENGLSPSQVGLGFPASQSAAGSGYVSPTVVDDSLDCLAAAKNCGSFVPSSPWPGIGGAMDWSINWDASNGYQFETTVGAYLRNLP